MLRRLSPQSGLGLQSSQHVTGLKGSAFKLTHVVSAGPGSSLAFPRVSDIPESGLVSHRVLKMEAAVVYNQILEVTAHSF